MNAKHLRTLHDLALTIPEPRLDMGSWVDEAYIQNNGVWDNDPVCGTKACLLGWATTVESFRQAGLRLDADGTPYLRRTANGAAYRGIEAAMALFELPYSIAADLFGWRTSIENDTPKALAAKIAELLELAD